MPFAHRQFDIPTDVNVETTDHGRYYRNQNGLWYPSVTTVLGHSDTEKDAALALWRSRVGDAEADRITNSAARRGETVHAAMERFLAGEPADPKAMPINRLAETQLREVLEEKLREVWAVEVPLFSDRMRVGGRVDLCGQWGRPTGVIRPSIIDFKTARREKREDEIRGYFVQTTLYSLMFEEMTGVEIPGIVVIIFSDETFRPLVFARSRRPYIVEAAKIAAKWHRDNPGAGP